MNIKVCENPDCGKEHDGSFGSGRFCSNHCAHSFCCKSQNKITVDKLNDNKFPNILSFKLKQWLFENNIKENKCEICGISEWNNMPINCALHHIDGNKHNNTLSNLIIICPNCHSLTENYTAKNIGKYD